MNGFEACRLRAGMTQTEVARHMGVKQCTVSAWEYGHSYPSGEKLPRLAALYGATIDELFKGAEETQKKAKIPRRERKLIEGMRLLARGEDDGESNVHRGEADSGDPAN